MVTMETNTAIIKWEDKVSTYLTCPIQSKGLRIKQGNNKKNIVIELYNSRDTLTPGYISIPIEKIPELITDLNQIYNNVTT